MDKEHDSRRNFHVVPQFEIGGEFDALCGGYVAVRDENHVGDGAAREYDAAYELANEIDATVLIGDGHNNAVGNEEDCADGES